MVVSSTFFVLFSSLVPRVIVSSSFRAFSIFLLDAELQEVFNEDGDVTFKFLLAAHRFGGFPFLFFFLFILLGTLKT